MNTKTLTIGSLFSGIGGLELGLECALRDGGFSAETAWQCEQDEWCRGILARHWPHVVRYDDVRNVGAVPRSQYAGYVDLLCGGFPCQDLSYAGNGAGLAGERSGLWGEFARIVRELRPRIVVVENVAALLARGLDVVLGELAALGYDAIWTCVRASDAGAPHRRDRLFIVAWLVDDAIGDGLVPVLGNVAGESSPSEASDARSSSQRFSRGAWGGHSGMNPDWEGQLMGFPAGWTSPLTDGPSDQENSKGIGKRLASRRSGTNDDND